MSGRQEKRLSPKVKASNRRPKSSSPIRAFAPSLECLEERTVPIVSLGSPLTLFGQAINGFADVKMIPNGDTLVVGSTGNSVLGHVVLAMALSILPSRSPLRREVSQC